MPIYEYQCKQCGVFEVTQRITESPLGICPTCGGDIHRLISHTSFVLKGSGWYATDYARSNGKSEADGTTSNEASASDSGDKPAAASSESKTTTAEASKPSGDKGAPAKSAD
jgi:putative FmdB family regulatory protein